MANIFDQFKIEKTPPETNVFDQFKIENTDSPKIDPELIEYRDFLIQDMGSYTEDDLEAAGFSKKDIEALAKSPPTDDTFKETSTNSESGLYPLPPSNDMYDGLYLGNEGDTYKNTEKTEISAFEVYNAYTDDPNSVVDPITGRIYYHDPVSDNTFILRRPTQSGAAVPVVSELWDSFLRTVAPDYLAKQPAGVNEGSTILQGIVDSATNTIEVAAALGDFAASKFDINTPFVEWTKQIPRQSSGSSKPDAVLAEGAGLAVSFFTGKLLGDIAIEGSEQLVKRFMKPVSGTSTWLKVGQPAVDAVYPTFKKLLRFASPEAGIALGAGTNTSTLITPFNVDPKDTDAEQILAARLNIFVDSVLGSGILEQGIKSGLKLADFINGASFGAIVRTLSEGPDAKTRSAIMNIIDDLASVEAEATAVTMDEARNKIIFALRQNSELIIAETAAIKTDPIFLDVFTAIQAGDVAPNTIQRAQTLSEGIITSGKNKGKLLVAQGRVNSETDRLLMEAENSALPNDATMDDVLGDIVETNQIRLTKQQQLINDAQVALKNESEEALNSILSDPSIASALKNLQNVSSSEVSALSAAKKKEIATALIYEAKNMTKNKNDLFEAIPDGAKFNYEAFGQLIEDIGKATDQFDIEGSEFLNRRLIATIREAYKKGENARTPTTGSVLDQYGNPMMSDAGQTDTLADELFAEGVDFKLLFQKIRPEVAALAEEAYRNGKNGVGKKLKEVVRFIDDQVEFVVSNNPEAAKAAQKAMDYYKNKFIPLWGDTPLDGVYDVFKKTSQRGIRPVKETTEVQQQVENMVVGNNSTPEGLEQLIKLLDESDAAVDPSTVQEYMVAKIFEDLYNDVINNGITNIDPVLLSNTIKQYSTQMRGNFDILASELDTLESKLRAASNNKESVVQVLQEYEKQFELMQNDAFSKLVKPLINLHNPNQISQTATAKLTDIIASKNGADDVRAILEASNYNPVILAGLKKLYLSELRRKAFTVGQDAAGAPVLSVVQVRNILKQEDAAGLAASGKVILEHDPMLYEVLQSVLRSAAKQQTRRNARTLPGKSNTAETQKYQDAVNTMVNVIVGPLNRIGTQARTAARIVGKALIGDVYHIAMDAIVADSQTALKIISEIEAHRMTKGVGPFRLPKELYEDVFSLGIRIGKYAEADRQDVYLGWDENLVNTAGTVDKAWSSAKGAVTDSKELIKRTFRPFLPK